MRKVVVLSIVAIAALLNVATVRAEVFDIDVTDGIFSPSQIEVKVGDRLVFHNSSRMIHSVHIDTRSENFGFRHIFDEHLIYPDTPLHVTITEEFAPGIYFLGCALHSRVRGRIEVVDSE